MGGEETEMTWVEEEEEEEGDALEAVEATWMSWRWCGVWRGSHGSTRCLERVRMGEAG